MTKKFLLVTTCLLLALSVLCGCGGLTSTYSKSGFNIDLPIGFFEKDILTCTYYLESTDSVMTALKEDFTALGGIATLKDYTDVIINTNKLSAESKHFKEGDKEFYYFIYEKNVSAKDFYYMAVTIQGKDAFWLVNFACEQKNKVAFESKFLEWAKTIKLD